MGRLLRQNKTNEVAQNAKALANTEVQEPKDITEDEDQEIIEVSQAKVKQALKTLLTRQNEIMAMLYDKHAEYNSDYFDGRLSVPLITIEKMSNKTLGAYKAGVDYSGIENHIYMNKNFIALNTETRILETLRHEMIHQYQDEVMYEKYNDDGELIHDGAKRPVEWHNKDFKEVAERVGIPANGKNCTGNPAHMPEAKSYNRKFACGCIASNGYPVTVWSTRDVYAVCTICGKPFKELKKAGSVIAVKQSDVEADGNDAVEVKMGLTYDHFAKFNSKPELTAKVKELKEGNIAYTEGIYQKGHNAYRQGYYYWIAWNDADKDSEDIKPKAPKKPGKKPSIKNKAKGVSDNDKGNIAKEA